MTSIFSTEHLRLQSLYTILSDERICLYYTSAAGPQQRSHSWVQVPRNLRPYSLDSNSRLPQPGELVTRSYISQEQGCPLITPGTGFPFRPLLGLSGIWWKYSNPPPHGVSNSSYLRSSLYSLGVDTQKTPYLNNSSIVGRCRGNVFTEQLPKKRCLL
jgi:hypothetical protein